MSFGWKCSRCTFHHRFKSERCCACGELRISKKQMTDFIKGIPIPDDTLPAHQSNNTNHGGGGKRTTQATLDPLSSSSTGGRNSTKNNQHAKKPAAPPTNSNASNKVNPVKKPKSAIYNPYTSKRPAVNTASAAPKPPPSTTQQQQPKASNTNASSSSHPPGQRQHPPNLPKPMPANRNLSRPHSSYSNGAANTAASTTAVPQQNRKPPPFAAAPAAPQRQKQQPPQQQQQQQPPQQQPRGRFPQQQPQQRLSFAPRPYQPGPVPLDEDTGTSWIFPKDDRYPRREYQFEIARTAVLHNTLVGLPTGLGKTLIASVVMYNYYRWFPQGKVVFMAPTLPLVNQQVKACYDIMGIPEKDTAVLTGHTNKEKRESVWSSRRAFFCTPQTLKNDIEGNRMDPTRVVLIVLDEAHRARGDYSYNKIVEQLETAGAQFRTLGLSATPGSQIQIIQEVVTSLRINRLECRSDEDPDVKQYIHDRATELVVVKQDRTVKEIERCLNAILDPALKRLQDCGALKHRGNATISEHTIRIAMKDNKDPTLRGPFQVALFFAGVRRQLLGHGVHVVRTKLNDMLKEKKKTGMRQMVESEQFTNLMNLVQKARSDLHNNTIEEKTSHNPKLEKLQDILIEHFRRAEEKGESSRAIVFSQLRESVAEIENVLKASRPLVRPRHFIGQGKGTGTKKKPPSDDDDETLGGTGSGFALKGMPQNVQQRVISEFKDNVFNTLICTCIGEEGLDIGEVDLIVNFDALQSPVRMLQRVGRTGRKRNGRVVYLLSEGREENDYSKSKGKEKTLMRAMKDPQRFTVAPTIPMLPVLPRIDERKMEKSHFHMSQVQGFGGDTAKKRRDKVVKRAAADNGWKLSANAEARRSALLGESNTVRTLGNADLLKSIRSRFLIARWGNSDEFLSRTNPSDRTGRVWGLLRAFEESNYASGLRQKQRKKARRRRRVHSAVDAFFPVTDSEEAFEELAWGKPEQRKNEVNKAMPETQMDEDEEELVDLMTTTRQQQQSDGEEGERRSELLDIDTPEPEQQSLRNETPETERLEKKRRPSPEERRPTNVAREQNTDPRVPELPVANSSVAGEDCELQDISNSISDNAEVLLSKHPSQEDAPELLGNQKSPVPVAVAVPKEVFELPTQESSSDEDSQDEDEAGTAAHPAKNKEGDVEKVGKPSKTAFQPNDPPIAEPAAFQDLEFCLPSQPSSSSEEEDSDDEKENAPKSTPRQSFATKRHDETVEQTDSDDSVGNRPISKKRKRINVAESPACESSQKEIDLSSDAPDQSQIRQKTRRKRRPAIEDTPESSTRVQPKDQSFCSDGLVDTQGSEATKRLVRRKHAAQGGRFAIEDTPTSAVVELRDDGDEDLLGDTQPSKTHDNPNESIEIKCLVCNSGESPDADPIYLCDGPGKGVKCQVAVHGSCYGVGFISGEEWRCDPCQHRFQGGSDDYRCVGCRSANGPLKVLAPGKWVHTFCREGPEMKAQQEALHEDDDDEEQQRKTRREARRKQLAAGKRQRSHFLHEEAEEDGGNDDEEEEDQVLDIEDAEEDHQGFINDSSQLGFSPDALDNIDPENEEDDVHRAVDLARERENEFSTPLLNRRMKSKKRRKSSVGSAEGLGSMAFIKSVIQHHKEGGNADDIEAEYARLEAEASKMRKQRTSGQKIEFKVMD